MLKVHVAFGFHVNLYHSFREDTNDQKGFAGDIRVIRHIIDVLNDYNRQGIPVKGTWDFENAFSLEETLPEYAPDIIENVRRRVEEENDEMILMGYNNGAMGAKTKKELEASVNWAISNDQNSGVKDLFGTYEPLLRPQEIMFTPSQTKTYNELGIEALCLYYSSVPFDGFRTLIPLLSEKHAFNPLNYLYKGDSIIIIPTYNTGDLIDFGSLRKQVKKLHDGQQSGEIDTDVLIFINMDADSEHWYGLGYPFPLNKLPNMTGIKGMIEEIKDLPYVVFDTPGNYLKKHRPLETITFTQDIADGSFDGYSSWSEKPFNRQIWTRLERARMLPAKAGLEDEAFKLRMRLLSTTHFGLSTPHLNANREKKALELSAKMVDCIDNTFIQKSWKGGVKDDLRFCLPVEKIPSMFNTTVPFVDVNPPRIQYKGTTYSFKLEKTTPLDESIGDYQLKGEARHYLLDLPEAEELGHIVIQEYSTKGIDGKFFSIKIKYPYTTENAYVYNEIAALQRPLDDAWEEVCPFEISFALEGETTILKRNYEEDISEYHITSFALADPANEELDSFNHQVTNGVVGMQCGLGGFLLATQKQVANSMAFCPMRIRKRTLHLNPFGTYTGKQRHHATHGNGLGAKAATYAAPQFSELAPAYNGAEEEFMLAIFPFKDKGAEQRLWDQAIGFSEGGIPAEEVKKDFCKSRPPKAMAANVKLKKLTTGVPLGLQAKIMLNGIKSRIEGGR